MTDSDRITEAMPSLLGAGNTLLFAVDARLQTIGARLVAIHDELALLANEETPADRTMAPEPLGLRRGH